MQQQQAQIAHMTLSHSCMHKHRLHMPVAAMVSHSNYTATLPMTSITGPVPTHAWLVRLAGSKQLFT
jgi:hypothetical protein